ncbi:lysophospholipid acyltransferase family protein [Clostridium sp. 1001271B_151109_B4]|uniref:lysophospholipid acyltransferase family protein n=1 Tax=Clostridium sp. 1001271B_151109_B4 TaxID=2787148 RepID=UPI00325F9F35
MLITGVKYLFYMIYTRLKGFKYEYIKRTQGLEKATDYASRSIYLWSKFTINVIGMDIRVKGRENIPDEPCLFVGNHTSILDIPVIFYSINKPVGFIAKKEVLKIPILSYWLSKGKCIALDRQNPRDAVRMISEGVENLKEGYSMMIFPEGTRSLDGKTLPFKKGSMKLATKAKVPILPVTIDASFTSFEDNNKFKPSTITVTFHKAIETVNLTKDEERTLSEDVRNIIIGSLRDEYKPLN